MHILLGFSATPEFVTMVKIGPHVHPKPDFALLTPLHGLVPFSSPGLNHPSLPSFPLAPPPSCPTAMLRAAPQLRFAQRHGNASRCCTITMALRAAPHLHFAHRHDGASRCATSSLRATPRRRFAPLLLDLGQNALPAPSASRLGA